MQRAQKQRAEHHAQRALLADQRRRHTGKAHAVGISRVHAVIDAHRFARRGKAGERPADERDDQHDADDVQAVGFGERRVAADHAQPVAGHGVAHDERVGHHDDDRRNEKAHARERRHDLDGHGDGLVELGDGRIADHVIREAEHNVVEQDAHNNFVDTERVL